MKSSLPILIFGAVLLSGLGAARGGQDAIVLQGSHVILQHDSEEVPFDFLKGLPGLKMVSYERKSRSLNDVETDRSELVLLDTAGTTATLTTGQPLKITVVQRGGDTFWLLPGH